MYKIFFYENKATQTKERGRAMTHTQQEKID